MKKLKVLAIALALTGLMGGVAQAQGPLAISKTGTGTWGLMAAAYSVIDSTILDGTVVSFDTTATVARQGVRPYTGTVIVRPYVMGIAVGNIPKSSRNQAGRVLLWGYHANAKMASSTYSANTLIKFSAGVHGAVATEVDTLSLCIGRFVSYNSNSTAANARGKVFLSSIGGRSALLKN